MMYVLLTENIIFNTFALVNRIWSVQMLLDPITIHSKFLSMGIWLFPWLIRTQVFTGENTTKDDENMVHASYVMLL